MIRKAALAINFDGVFASTREEMVPAERFPNAWEYNVERGRRYPKLVITYHLPFSGNADLIPGVPGALTQTESGGEFCLFLYAFGKSFKSSRLSLPLERVGNEAKNARVLAKNANFPQPTLCSAY